MASNNGPGWLYGVPSAVLHFLIGTVSGYFVESVLDSVFKDPSQPGVLGSALSLTALISIVSAVWASVWLHYYKKISHGDSSDPLARKAYLALRTGVGAAGGSTRNFYLRNVESLLKLASRFFDGSESVRSSVDGASSGWPELSVRAYDRCLLLGIIYPFVSLFAVWSLSGESGPVATAVGLPDAVEGWRRGVLGVAVLSMLGCAALAMSARGWRSMLFLAFGLFVYVGAGVFAVAVAGAGAGAVTVALFVVVNVVFAVAGASAVFAAVGLIVVVGLASPFAGASGFAVAVGGAFFIFGAARVVFDPSRRYAAVMYASFSAIMLLAAALAPLWLASQSEWQSFGTVLLFFGVLVLINAPVDWLSIGLTRRLLRHGLAAGHAGRPLVAVWWGAVDMVFAIILVFVLAVLVLLGVQCFNATTIAGGGEVLVPTGELLTVLGNPVSRGRPEYWWIYVMIGSTLIPSVLHVAIASFAGLCWLAPERWIAKHLPEERAPLEEDWWGMAALLATARIASIALGVGLVWWLMTVIYADLLPWLGLGWLDALRTLDTWDLPGRIVSGMVGAGA